MDPEARIGDLVEGRYRIDRVVGRGGFGVVYAARHLVLDKRVALKVLAISDELPADEKLDRASRLLEEARLLSRLRHPNVVAAIDSGLLPEDDAGVVQPYIVLEWCDGPTLKAWLAAKPGGGAAMAWAIVGPLASAIAVAHELGIVHRDLKPSNVMLDGEGGARVPKLIDFGIAKLVASDAEPGSGETKTDAAFKPYTPAYAAPEQIAGARTGPWTDVHALALLFTEIATGRAPYGADAGLAAIDPERPTPQRLGVDVGAFEPVLARALALRPAERFADGSAFAAALTEAAAKEGLDPGVRVAPHAPRAPAPSAPRRAPIEDRTDAPASVTVASTRSGAAANTPARRRRYPWLVVGGLLLAGTIGGAMLARGITSPIVAPGSPASSAQPLASLSLAAVVERIRTVAPILTSSETGGQTDVLYGDAASPAALSRTVAAIPLGLDAAGREQVLTRLGEAHRDAGSARAEWIGLLADGGTVVTVRDADHARLERVLDAVLGGRIVADRRVVPPRARAAPPSNPTRLADLGPDALRARIHAAKLTIELESAAGPVAALFTVQRTTVDRATIKLFRFAPEGADAASRQEVENARATKTPFAYARDGDAMLVVQAWASLDPELLANELLVGLGAEVERGTVP